MESHYREQAEICMADAVRATLPNVRDRAQRAADAWTAMAERAARQTRIRASRET